MYSIETSFADEMAASATEHPKVADVLRAVTIEHARALRASTHDELPRQHLDELRAMYCSPRQSKTT